MSHHKKDISYSHQGESNLKCQIPGNIFQPKAVATSLIKPMALHLKIAHSWAHLWVTAKYYYFCHI